MAQKTTILDILNAMGHFIKISNYYYVKTVQSINGYDDIESFDEKHINLINRSANNILKSDHKQQTIHEHILHLCHNVHSIQNIKPLLKNQQINDLFMNKKKIALKKIETRCENMTLNDIVGAPPQLNSDYSKSLMYINLIIRYFSHILFKFFNLPEYNNYPKIFFYNQKSHNVQECIQKVKNVITYMCQKNIKTNIDSSDYIPYIIEKSNSSNIEIKPQFSKKKSIIQKSIIQKSNAKSSKNISSVYSEVSIKKEKPKNNRIHYNFSRVSKNKQYSLLTEKDLPDSNSHKLTQKLMSSNTHLQKLVKRYNDISEKLQEENLMHEDHTGSPLFQKDGAIFNTMDTNFQIDNSLSRTIRHLKHKILELKLMRVLLNQNNSQYNDNQKKTIDDIDVLYFSDLNAKHFNTNMPLFTKVPVLVSSGSIVDSDSFFDSSDLMIMDNENVPINRDFYSVPYLIRFIYCLVHLKIGNLIVTQVTFNENGSSINVYFDVHEDVDSSIRSFRIMMPASHYVIFFDFVKRNEMYTTDENSKDGTGLFVYNMSSETKKSIQNDISKNVLEFPILNYGQFKTMFQSSTHYKNKTTAYIMNKPITSVEGGYTIDLSDFEDFEDSFSIFELDTAINQNQDDQSIYEKYDKKILYKIKNEYFLPDNEVFQMIDRVFSKKVMCRNNNNLNDDDGSNGVDDLIEKNLDETETKYFMNK